MTKRAPNDRDASRPPPGKRALSNLGGPIRTGGDPKVAARLSAAWERAASCDPDALTHGFHSWPGRMHWAVARTVFEGHRGRRVLDPFCGGGTVLVEARVAGREATGVDLNPLALRVCEVKLDARDEEAAAQLIFHAEEVAARSEERVRDRVAINVALPGRETRWFDGHVLKEMGGLLEEIRAVPDERDRRALEIVFSSIVIKVSRQRSDTSPRAQEKRIRKGLATEIFLAKARELADRQRDLPQGTLPRLIEGDARRLPATFSGERFDLIFTSPPYGGTYDYAAHHERRILWLGLDGTRLKRAEMGARRHLGAEDGAERWEAQVDGMLGSMRRVLDRSGSIVLVMGDALVGGVRVDVEPQLARLAPRHGLVLRAIASQERRDPGRRATREEHLVVLEPE